MADPDRFGARWGGAVAALLLTAVRAPVSVRALRELLFCLIGVGFALGVLATPFGLAGLASAIGWGAAAVRAGQPMPAVAGGFLIGVPAILVMLLVSATLVGRRLGMVHRLLSARLLGQTVPAPGMVRLGVLDSGLEEIASAGNRFTVSINVADPTGS